MGSYRARTLCKKCTKDDLIVEHDYYSHGFLLECVACGYFGEIITRGPYIYNFETSDWEKNEKAFLEDLHFKKVTGNLYIAFKKFGLLRFLLESGNGKWLNSLRSSGEICTYYKREAFINKPSDAIGCTQAVHLNARNFQPLEIYGTEVKWV